MVVTTRRSKVVYDEVPRRNVETPNKEKDVVFQSGGLAEELNNDVLKDDDEP